MSESNGFYLFSVGDKYAKVFIRPWLMLTLDHRLSVTERYGITAAGSH